MAEFIKVAAKKPEAKRENRPSQTQKTGPSQSISSPVEQILFLQRTIGNQAVGKLIKSGVLQAKLKIGQPGDKYEQEADRVAEQVMGMPEPQISKVSGKTTDNPVQRRCPRCVKKPGRVEEEKIFQAKEASDKAPEVTPEIENNISAIRGGGQPLPESVRTFYESRFGHDFSQVRVHTGSHAFETAKSINARAFTVGNNIGFGGDQFASGSHEWRKLLAHELAHTIQQGATNISPPASTPHCPTADPFITAQNQRSTSTVVQSKKIVGSDSITHELKHVLQQGASPPEQTMQRQPSPNQPPPPPEPTPQEEASAYWQEELKGWIDIAYDETLGRDEKAKAFRVILLMEKRKVDFADTEAAVDDLVKIENIANDEDATLQTFGKAINEPMETFPAGFPKAWSRRIREELSLADLAPSLEQAAHQARDNRAAVAARIKPSILLHGLPVPFKLALTIRYFPLVPAYARGGGDDIVNEFARASVQYGIVQIPWDFVVKWNSFVDSIANAIINGDAVVNFDMYKAFRDQSFARVRRLPGDVQMSFSRSTSANEPPALDFPVLTLAMTLMSFSVSISNVTDSWAESERMFAAELAGADKEIANSSGIERHHIGEIWALYRGYTSDAAIEMLKNMASGLPEMAEKTGLFLAAQFNLVTAIIADLIALYEAAKDLYDVGQEVVEAGDRVSNAETVVDLQREIAQLELILASARVRIALDIAALKAVGKGLKKKASSLKGQAGAFAKARRQAHVEANVLESTRHKTDGFSLSKEEVQTELDVARRSPIRKVDQAEFDAEIEIGNEHTWKHQRETGFWCRFSPGPPLCVSSLEGKASRIVLGGGLSAHEKVKLATGKYSHTILEHVEKSQTDLANRLAANKNLMRASTFTSRTDAELFIGETLDRNASKIESWLKIAKLGDRMVPPLIEDFGPQTTGQVLQRGTTTTTPATKVRVIIEKTPSKGGLDYTIVTSYPEL